MRTLIVTASNDHFSPPLQGLLSSLRQWPEPPFADIAVLDLGLTPDRRAWIEQVTRRIAQPGWDFPVDDALRGHQPEARAVTARPFLPRYFPGYDIYLWMDADTWVQERFALDQCIAAAAEGALAAVPERHACYRHPSYVEQWRMDRMTRYFSETAAAMGRWDDFVNSGVFALRGDAPHWALWAKWLGIGLENARYSRFSDQTALNHAVWTEGLPVAHLPARCNWLCHLALPRYDHSRQIFCEPDREAHAIGVLHLAGPSKNFVLSGEGAPPDLRYPGPNRARRAGDAGS
jgi:hypothetical protein